MESFCKRFLKVNVCLKDKQAKVRRCFVLFLPGRFADDSVLVRISGKVLEKGQRAFPVGKPLCLFNGRAGIIMG